ncbi:cytochrome b [Sabulicella glaciei]|uniref:Cytochrome b/b6 domain-containing protein n=1 Tax=Sabulicella glaciei TaxID=2984948 RepID=A0ABT3P0E9_9PROT|nr:cytochrome b/b6 domain-containing protein [Roseococcus sp. MDT2-1-1]MCW8087892.1 cytochrome b/b6 domain-containing protein [Roseococcus sp. MDT2-1-1]
MGYAAPAKWFHWITVALMLVALPAGFVIGHIREADKMSSYAIHESAGLTIFLVSLARLAFRISHPPPEAAHQPRLFRIAATTVHHALYAALIAQPVLGFLATNAFGFPMQGATAYLGFIDLPRFMDANVPLAEALLNAHRWLGWTIAALLVLHVSAVVFHQAIRRDGTLERMI